MINKLSNIKKIENFFKQNYLVFFIKNFNLINTNYQLQKKYFKNFNLITFKYTTDFLLNFFQNSIKKIITVTFIKYSTINLIKSVNLKLIKIQFLLILYKFNFYILSIKLNNKIYNFNIFKKNYSLNYYLSKKLFYKFIIVQLKKLIFSSK